MWFSRFGGFPKRKKKVAEFDLNGNLIEEKSKYGAKKVELDGYKFDSKGEATCYEFLRDHPRVTIIEIHPTYLLQEWYTTKERFTHKKKKWKVEYVSIKENIRKIEYEADFLVTVEGDVYIIDFKGVETTDFKLKRKIFEKRYPDEILVVAKNMKELRLAIF